MDLHGRSLLKETDLNQEEFLFLVDLARQLRADKRKGVTGKRLAGRNIALIFEKTSTRTRSAFEVGAHDEGGHVTYLGPGESQLGHKESVKDTARVLGRMFDGIEYRGFTQESMDTLGEFAGVPVWNGLTDTWHPTQMLADILTMTDHCRKPLAEMSFCYLGDGRNNTANSLLVTGATLGMDARICAPAALQPSAEVRDIAAGLAAGSGARLLVTADVNTGVAGADFVYTDVWLSLGEPEDQWDTRIDQLLPYQGTPPCCRPPAIRRSSSCTACPPCTTATPRSARRSTPSAGWTRWKSPTRCSSHPPRWSSTRRRTGCTRSRPS